MNHNLLPFTFQHNVFLYECFISYEQLMKYISLPKRPNRAGNLLLSIDRVCYVWARRFSQFLFFSSSVLPLHSVSAHTLVVLEHASLYSVYIGNGAFSLIIYSVVFFIGLEAFVHFIGSYGV